MTPGCAAQIVQTIRDAVLKNRGHEAIFGYFVGNEIPTDHGPLARRAAGHAFCRASDRRRPPGRSPSALLLRQLSAHRVPPAVRTSISTRSMSISSASSDFERYLARLQNLAEDKPLIMGEFGLDTIRKGEDRCRPRCSTGISIAWCAAARPGTIFFSWTDEWFTGGFDDHRLGVRPCHARPQAEAGLPLSEAKTARRPAPSPRGSASRVSEGQHDCLLL